MAGDFPFAIAVEALSVVVALQEALRKTRAPRWLALAAILMPSGSLLWIVVAFALSTSRTSGSHLLEGPLLLPYLFWALLVSPYLLGCLWMNREQLVASRRAGMVMLFLNTAAAAVAAWLAVGLIVAI